MPEVDADQPGAPPADPFAPLSAEDRRRLTFWKWRYQLEDCGFTRAQVDELIVLRLRVLADSAGR